MNNSSFQTRWGAQLRDDGAAVFRLWAPAVEKLVLRLGEDDDREMERRDHGWFELEANRLEEGTAYRFILPDGMAVPDPASRAQEGDVYGPSLLMGSSFDWQAENWAGRPWEEAAVYELHPGTFSPHGGFDGIRRKLDYLAEIGFTAIELMPVAQFSGNRGWGYDGVLPYCAHSAYGGAAGLKQLVDAAHERGLMMILDVVYNHFGPDGNYLSLYAPDFFDPDRHTPWGPAIRFEEPAVRAFFLDNPIYWLEEFRFDGLRFDAIDQIKDKSEKPILEEMARNIRATFPDRHIHLMTEDERNIVELHPRDSANRPILFTAEWNDDFHHAAHCLATNEDAGYYAGFADDSVGHLARALAEGFCYQGEPYAPREGKPRGVPSAGQPPLAFVDFLQNHDQIGNRAFGDRLSRLTAPETLRALQAILLLSPQIPLLFMGEEWGAETPFQFFCDFGPDLGPLVTEGRRKEFAQFPEFSDPALQAKIPDPCKEETFDDSKLNWGELNARQTDLDRTRQLLSLRRQKIVPLLPLLEPGAASYRLAEDSGLSVSWPLRDGRCLELQLNLRAAVVPGEGRLRVIYATNETPGVAWWLRESFEPGQ